MPSGLLGAVYHHWVDIGSAVFAVAAAGRRAAMPGATRDRVISDFLNGAALFPFLLIMPAVASADVLDVVKESSGVTFFLSGGIGAIWVVGELL